jgi:hypothetical protein
MATGFLFPVTPLTQLTFRSPVTVQVTFTLTGGWPDFVQVYAQEAGSQPANVVDAILATTIDWAPPNPEGLTTFELPGGNAFTIWLCPRNGTEETLDDDYDGEPWETSCTKVGSITTQVLQSPTDQPTKPYIISYHQEPATLKGDGSITVSWVSSPYNKFLIWWTLDGQPLAQGEVNAGGSSGSATSGSWTTNQAVSPGAAYTFAVEGGTSAGLFAGYNWSGWGNTVPVTAMQNLRSLVQFLKHSGINPAGLSVSSIMGGQTSLKKVMKLT